MEVKFHFSWRDSNRRPLVKERWLIQLSLQHCPNKMYCCFSKRCLENNLLKIARKRSTHRENISRRQFRSNLDKFWLKVNLWFIARKVKSAPFRILSGSPFRVQNKLLSSRFKRRYQEYFSSLVELSFKEGILKVEVSC